MAESDNHVDYLQTMNSPQRPHNLRLTVKLKTVGDYQRPMHSSHPYKYNTIKALLSRTVVDYLIIVESEARANSLNKRNRPIQPGQVTFGTSPFRDHGVVHFGTYPFRYLNGLDVTFGTTTRSPSVPLWTTSVPKIFKHLVTLTDVYAAGQRCPIAVCFDVCSINDRSYKVDQRAV